MDMRFGTWNVKSLYWTGSQTTAQKDIANFKLDLVGVLEVRWYRCGTEPAGNNTFLYGKRNENHESWTGFFVHNIIIPVVTKVEFVSNRISYIILRGHWCDIIVLNVDAVFDKSLSTT
jgi:hypothetical protein